MSVKTIDHLAICVRDLDAARDRFAALFGAEFQFVDEIASLKVRSAFFKLGDKLVTLEQPTAEDSSFAAFLNRNGEGVHHVAIEVDDLAAYKAELEAQGITPVNVQMEDPLRREFLILPKDALGMLVQVIEWRGELKHSLDARIAYSRDGYQMPGG